MAARIVNVYTENLPALRLIGKRCLCEPGPGFVAKWDEWLENDWFDQLEKLAPVPENRGAYLGATHGDEYWIGMLFLPGTSAPHGFEFVENPATKYAVFQFEGRKDKELLGEDGINLVLEEMRKRGLVPSECGLCIERYNRPIAPDKAGKVLLECLYAIQ